MKFSLFEKILQNRLWLLGAFLILSIWGAFSLIELPIDAVPDITNVQVMINSKTGTLDPEKIEKTVTYVVETEMAGLPGVEDIRSLSKYGLSQVIVIFKEGTDVYFVRQQVAQRLQTLQLPPGITAEMGPVTTGLGEIVMYTVNAVKDSELANKNEKDRLLYLREVQDFVIRPELKKIKGLADVDSSGGFRREVHINVDIGALEKYGLTLEEVSAKLESIGDSSGGGYIQKDNRQIIVRTAGDLKTLTDIGQIPIKLATNGKSIRVRDIASVRNDSTQRVGAATQAGEEAVLGTALMTSGANSRQVATAVEQALKEIHLPKDVYVDVVYTRSFLVNETIGTVEKSLAEGALLVVLVLLLLLGNFRAAIIVAIAIPVSMLLAAIGMKTFGISANLMSLGAIDFGLLVDGSVVMIDNILRHLKENQHKSFSWRERINVVVNAAKEVARPVLLGLFIIMIVYVPILALEGVEGKMFHPMALTVLMALGASLLAAIFLMPVLAFIFVNPPREENRSEFYFAKILGQPYGKALEFSLRKRKWLVGLTLAFALVAAGLYTRLGSDFIPQLDEGDIVLGLVRSTDISLNKSIADQKLADKIIAEFPEVQTVFSRIGTPESATDPMGVNFSDTFVILKKDRSRWPTQRSKSELAEAISKEISARLPGHEISVTQPIAMRFNEILEGSRADVSLRIFGPDLGILLDHIDKAAEIIHGISGVDEAEMDSLTALRKTPVLDLNMNYAAMASYGVSLHHVNTAMTVAMSGLQLGNFYENDRRFPIILHLDEEARDNPAEIARIPVGLDGGGSIPLKAVTNFVESEQVTTIARSFGKRYAALSIFLKDRDVSSFVAEARAKINEGIPLTAGYSFEWGGQFKNLQQARLKLLMIVPLTLLLIFFILYRNFASLSTTLLVFSSIPLAVTGGITALYLRDLSFSISASIGFIALLGISILNSMVLIDFIQQLQEKGMPVRQAVMEGTRLRLRPVLMTAMVAGLGFLPMTLNTGMGAEVQRPLATVVIGGLITSTFLTLFLLPNLYIWFKEIKK